MLVKSEHALGRVSFAVVASLLIAGCARAPLKTGKIRIACIGDSITWGYAMTNRVEECYPAQLQRLLGDAYDVRNFGDPGSGVYLNPERESNGWASHPWSRGEQARAAYAFEPDIVVCNLGINDMHTHQCELKCGTDGCATVERGRFRREYIDLLRAFEHDGRLPRFVIWTKLGPLGRLHRNFGSSAPFLLRGDLEAVALEVQAETLDLYEPLLPLVETRHFAPDGIHPEGLAQGVIAEITADKILGLMMRGRSVRGMGE